jgi:apolipoprotein N-acyltransferase
LKITANQFAILAAAVLLVITALGNAKIMFVVSVIGLLLGLRFLRKDTERSGVFAVTVGFFCTMIISMVIWLKK